jgi:hypothetical protein
MSDLRLAALGAFVATGLVLVSFLLLALVCAYSLVSTHVLADRVPLIYVTGTVAGICLAYARCEYANLRRVRAEHSPG